MIRVSKWLTYDNHLPQIPVKLLLYPTVEDQCWSFVTWMYVSVLSFLLFLYLFFLEMAEVILSFLKERDFLVNFCICGTDHSTIFNVY